MSRVRVCLFVLFLVLNIAVQFGDCEDTTNNVNCDEDVPPGSDKTRISFWEWPFTKPTQNDNVLARSFNSNINKIRDYTETMKFKLIFPGTLWCGDGDRAKDENDLGKFKKTDACCRAHDNCTSSLMGGEIKLNLHNNGIFTRSACTCDNEFYECLKNANNILSKGIGKTYFNILGPQCFSCVCPENGCNASTSSSECKDQCRRYQWNDSPRF
ncbi:phospholipase A2-like [Linepithema humile]|uniref:phospholipase A2-like n=1 Tax=Linepithema humile TaxID=83485 RepID=UPI00351E9F0C